MQHKNAIRILTVLLLGFLAWMQGTTALAAKKPQVLVNDLTVEGLHPTGSLLVLDNPNPRFSWKITSTQEDVVQTSYRIIVSSTQSNARALSGDLWDSGRVPSANSLWVAYQGKAMKSNQHAWVNVQVETNRGTAALSEPVPFVVGLLGETHWRGRWIGLESLQPGEQRGFHTQLAARYLRKEFKLKKRVAEATAYVAGLGLYSFFVNGQELDPDHVLKPVPSDFRKTIYYNAYDLTDLLNAAQASEGGQVCLGVVLGNGRYFPMRQTKPYKVPVFGLPKCRLNVLITYDDGSQETWSTDEKWKISASGPIRSNNEYDGEVFDARKAFGPLADNTESWCRPGFDDRDWMQAERSAIPEGTLRAQTTPNMVRKAVGTGRLVGSRIIDFGQNMAGQVAYRVWGKAGDTIRLCFAEKLKADGSLYRDNLRTAQCEDVYVCNGQEKGELHFPRFVTYGFRYVEVLGPQRVDPAAYIAYTVSDDMASSALPVNEKSMAGITTSDTLFNKVLRNAWWGILSNYKGMPVDCPQRDERQPWLGDRTAGCLGESFLFDNRALYAKWVRDIIDSQRSDGCIDNVSPAYYNYYEDNVTWPAALPAAVDMLLRQYGDSLPARECYDGMKKWMNHILDEYSSDGIVTKDKYGDWCMPPEKLELIHAQDPSRQTDGALISTAYAIHIMRQLETFASISGHEADVELWKSRRQAMTEAFNRHFLTVKRGTSVRPGHVLYPDSVFYGNNTVTANILPLAFGIVPDSVKQEVVKNVVTQIITPGKGRVTCGVIGISWLLEALSDQGFADVAYLLATNSAYPSWGYMAKNGATTIWELWNGDKANPRMNSGNHVMLLGDLLTWAYRYLGGMRWDASQQPRVITFKPSFDIPDCFNVSARTETPWGLAASKWSKTREKLEWDIVVPCNTTAEVWLPGGEKVTVGSGSHHFSRTIDHRDKAIVNDQFLYEFASFPEAHASTIVELKNGDLLAAYFGGTKERNPDVCIWVSRKPHGAKDWEAPKLVADGTDPALHLKPNQTAKPRKACWNPVLFAMPNGEVWLFFKIGVNVADWQGWLVKSKDGGRTWSQKEMLPKGFIGPVKNKPEIINGRLVCASSTEGKGGWRFHVELYDLKTGQWTTTGPIPAEERILTDDQKMHPIKCIQPSILKLKDGRLQVLMRTHNAYLATSYSSDGGLTWSKVTLSNIPNNQSGTDAVTLRDGRHVLIYNNFQTVMGTPKGPRTPLSLAMSTDDGRTWHHVLTLEDSPISQYSYPAIIQGKNGHLYCVYTWRRQRIAFKEVDPDLLHPDNTETY
jgi:alpha-L-rhamnosidase